MTTFDTFDEHKRTAYSRYHHYCSVFGQHIRVRLRPHTRLLHQTRITSNFKFNTNVLSIHSGPNNTTPFHTFQKRKCAAAHHRHCSVFRQHMRVWLRPYTTVLNTNNIFKLKHTPIQTHQLFVSSRTNTAPFHTFNEHKRTAVTTIIVVYLHRTSGWDYDLILYRTRI